MKRLFIIAAAVLSAGAVTPAAHAGLVATNVVSGGGTQAATQTAEENMSILNPILNKFPVLSGPDRRYLCVINDQIDKSWCVYVPIP